MKKTVKLYLIVILLFAVLFAAANLLSSFLIGRREDSAYVLMNRVVNEVQTKLSEGGDTTPEGMDSLIRLCYEDRKKELTSEFGRGSLPEKVYYLPAEAGNSSVSLLNRSGSQEKLWALHSGDEIIGFLVFGYSSTYYTDLRILLNCVLAAAFLISVGVCIYVSHVVIAPFERLTAYPEKLSKNEISDKLPESGNRLFGRFVWGINMLSDRLTNDRKRINELSRDHMTMMTTIAHGIKTPVANIKLYSDAIATGLYQPDGIPNESDAEIAAKISKNADEVSNMVTELIKKASNELVDFEPQITSFYLEEIMVFLREEYDRRLELLHIPHSFELTGNAIINSDKSGLCRILSQLMENAIKYGNGEGIFVKIGKEEAGFYFSVRNKGSVPGANEIPYLFNSFWRGSNAEGIEGSGIGLFESREIARRLYGDLYANSDPENGEMEFDLYLPEQIQE